MVDALLGPKTNLGKKRIDRWFYGRNPIIWDSCRNHEVDEIRVSVPAPDLPIIIVIPVEDLL